MRKKGIQAKDIPDQEIFSAVNRFHNNAGPPPEIALADKYPPKVVLAKVQKMVDRGALDYDVSLRTAWVVR